MPGVCRSSAIHEHGLPVQKPLRRRERKRCKARVPLDADWIVQGRWRVCRAACDGRGQCRLGLLSEGYHPGLRRQTALSHIAVINTTLGHTGPVLQRGKRLSPRRRSKAAHPLYASSETEIDSAPRRINLPEIPALLAILTISIACRSALLGLVHRHHPIGPGQVCDPEQEKSQDDDDCRERSVPHLGLTKGACVIANALPLGAAARNGA